MVSIDEILLESKEKGKAVNLGGNSLKEMLIKAFERLVFSPLNAGFRT